MSARLTLRARQILNDPTLGPNQKIDHPDVLLLAMQDAAKRDPAYLQSVLDSIDDDGVRESMRLALS